MVSSAETRRVAYLNPDHFKSLEFVNDIRRNGYEVRLKPFYSLWELMNKLRGKTVEGWPLEEDKPIKLPRGRWRLSRFGQRLVKYLYARVT